MLLIFLWGNVLGQDTLASYCNDKVPESYRLKVISQKSKTLDLEKIISSLDSTSNLTDSNLNECDYLLKYINCEGEMINYSNIAIGGSLCAFLRDDSLLFRLKQQVKQSGPVFQMYQYGENYIVFIEMLVTGNMNEIWCYFERKAMSKNEE